MGWGITSPLEVQYRGQETANHLASFLEIANYEDGSGRQIRGVVSLTRNLLFTVTLRIPSKLPDKVAWLIWNMRRNINKEMGEELIGGED